jgi:hypothetical protein
VAYVYSCDNEAEARERSGVMLYVWTWFFVSPAEALCELMAHDN